MISSMDFFRNLFLFFFLIFIPGTSSSVYTISPGRSISDGDTIVSRNKMFELGFFSPGSSTRRYVGIWYRKVSIGTVVWVANRESPVLDRAGVLNFTDRGVLVLLNATKHVIWSSKMTRKSKNPVAQLMDSGNFVVRNEDNSEEDNYLWQSFDYPADTNLPGMKIGRNFITGMDWTISSWKSLDEPAKGEYSCGFDLRGFPQLVCKKGSVIQYRTGSWNGIRFTGAIRQVANAIYRYEFVFNEKEIYYKTELLNRSVVSRLVVNASGITKRLTWIDQKHGWAQYYATGEDQCNNFANCGPNAKCNDNDDPVCSCFDGFEPKSPGDWNSYNWSGGCVRNTPLGCDRGEDFVKHWNIKLPDTSGSWYNVNIGLLECKELCLRNCSCMAYANSDIRNGGSGCLHWFNELVDVREFKDFGQDLYIRMSSSFMDKIRRERQLGQSKKIGAIVLSVVTFIGFLVLGIFLFVRKRKLEIQGKKNIGEFDFSNKSGKKDLDLPIINLKTIIDATNNFSSSNKLGEGGFGPVYKGILEDGQEVAAKRLSVNSGQGLEEFKNEVLLIAKLQHRNLVKLLGCCIEGDETMLIYEFMPNKSLDYFIFDETKRKLLDWPLRINIINGIARGLLYLHQDSRLRIIHRDLKASNVLLDNSMNPKISDFGLAKTFWGDQTEAKTRRVVGTYGYMSPEYAVDGRFSIKSDVFSFGVLILEIVSGKKNRRFNHPDHHHNLLGHTWRLWNEGRHLELLNELISDSSVLSRISRSIHVGLLCVQQRPGDRPMMSSVVLMLDSEIPLPEPKKPGFFTERSVPDEERESSSSPQKSPSTNYVTISDPEPR